MLDNQLRKEPVRRQPMGNAMSTISTNSGANHYGQHNCNMLLSSLGRNGELGTIVIGRLTRTKILFKSTSSYPHLLARCHAR